jgi:hypothetical protein
VALIDSALALLELSDFLEVLVFTAGYTGHVFDLAGSAFDGNTFCCCDCPYCGLNQTEGFP